MASYQYRIGDWQRHLRYAINFHPSLLPQFRGAYPLVNGLLQRCDRWGVTCHKVAAEFDAGDILAQRAFDVAPDETHDTLDLRSLMAATALAAEVAQQFAELWHGARPQAPGSYAPLFADADRTIDFGDTVAQILHTVRAFGRLECLATVNGVRLHVGHATGWLETHAQAPGTVAHTDPYATVVACRDGYVAIQQWSLFAPGAVIGTPAR